MLRWSRGWKTTYKEKDKLFSLEKRESKGNLPAVCSYLTGYRVDYQGDGVRFFSEMHSGRMGGQQKQAGTQETQTQHIDFFFLTVE